MRNFKNILKRLKKIWRQKRVWATGLIGCMLVVSINGMIFPIRPSVVKVNGGIETEVVLKSHYVCGDSTTEKQLISKVTLQQLQLMYEGWNIKSYEDDKAIFEREVWDLSPQCKQNGYFGISDDGYVTLFNGPPHLSEVIETFFQIDMERIRSSLPEEPVSRLMNGMRVNDMAEYNSILSMLSPYSTD
ncbi:MAG: BofC C-terminal domain-containing protein [Bacilli bacterium]